MARWVISRAQPAYLFDKMKADKGRSKYRLRKNIYLFLRKCVITCGYHPAKAKRGTYAKGHKATEEYAIRG